MGHPEDKVHSLRKASDTQHRKPWWIIDPRHSTRLGYWDLATSLALLWTAVVTPVEVAFLVTPGGDKRWSDGLYLTNRLIDVVFLSDMVLQFFVGFADEKNGAGLSWKFGPEAIAKNYVTSTWFLLDSVSIASSVPDLFDLEGFQDLVVLRVVRVVRLIKIVRVLRGSRIFKRWEIRFAIDYAMLELAKTCVMLAIVCHWFACIWGIQASFDPLNSWPGEMDFCQPWSGSDIVADCPPSRVCTFDDCASTRSCPPGINGTVCSEPFVLYMDALCALPTPYQLTRSLSFHAHLSMPH